MPFFWQMSRDTVVLTIDFIFIEYLISLWILFFDKEKFSQSSIDP